MTPEEILAAARQLHEDADTTFTISGARAAAKRGASLIFYLAKLHMPPEQAKAIKHGLPKPRKRKRK